MRVANRAICIGYSEPDFLQQAVAEIGNSFSKPNLSRMVNLVEAVPDPEIVSTQSTQLN
jgi:hypothetical protein